MSKLVEKGFGGAALAAIARAVSQRGGAAVVSGKWPQAPGIYLARKMPPAGFVQLVQARR